MVKINSHFLKLQSGYLFPEISRRVKAFSETKPKKELIRLGIGDVTNPLPPSIIEAFHQGVDEMAAESTFKGYGPEQGYAFLREVIAKKDYQDRGINISADEIFISDGSKCDTGNIVEIFDQESNVAVSDPVYPVYVDTNVMHGRSGKADDAGRYQGITYMPCLEEKNFLPQIPKGKIDIVYLCFPNNPTGATASRDELKKWVDYARKNEVVILFDAAYEAFIRDEDIPRSIYEIKGADEVAIEFRSFSKNAGFTGTRCAFTIVPKKLVARGEGDNKFPLHALWNRRQSTKFNGVSYPVQKAAAAVYTSQGQKEVKALVDYYMENAQILSNALRDLGYVVYGGVNAPYVWVKTKGNKKSWELFDFFLNEVSVVGTPGSGFGPSGEGYFRFSAFGRKEKVEEAMKRIKEAEL